jgi:biotin carboxylase
MGRLLLLVPAASYRIGDFLDAAHKLGAEVVVGSDRATALSSLSPERFLLLDFADPEGGVERIVAFARRYPLDAIVAADDETTLLAAMAARALDLPHNPPEAVGATRDKYEFRRRMARAGLPTPAFARLALDGDPERAAAAATYPCVLKPLALAASRGVIRADDPQAFVAAFRRIARILRRPDAALSGPAADHLLVESYIPGKEVALDALLMNGRLEVLALFDKPDALEGPFFEETLYITPSRLPERMQAEIAAAAAAAAAAVGLVHGPLHAELRVNEQGVWAIEIAPRTLGGRCSRVLRFDAGMCLEELVLRQALGLPMASFARETGAAGVMMIPIPAAGVLREVKGRAAARAVPGIEEVTIAIPCGRKIEPLPEGGRYLGFLFARSAAPEAVEASLREAHRRLDFTIEPLTHC